MQIISISGLDGSGKSTQAQMLKTHFEKQGKKVIYFHAIQFSFARKLKEFKNRHCLACKITNTAENIDSMQEKSVTSANYAQIRLRKLAFIIDTIRFKFFKKKLERQGYDYLISDRYFYDSIVNIAYLLHKNAPSHIEKLILPADKAFYLKIQPESIMTRDRVPDQGLEYLKDKKKLYDMYATLWNFQTIDGSKDANVLFEEIKNAIKSNS